MKKWEIIFLIVIAILVSIRFYINGSNAGYEKGYDSGYYDGSYDNNSYDQGFYDGIDITEDNYQDLYRSFESDIKNLGYSYEEIYEAFEILELYADCGFDEVNDKDLNKACWVASHVFRAFRRSEIYGKINY